MKWTETVTSIAGMVGVVAVLWIGMIDGLSREVIALGIVAVAGLGGYAIARDWLRRKEQ